MNTDFPNTITAVVDNVFDACQDSKYKPQQSDIDVIHQAISLLDDGSVRAIRDDRSANPTAKKAILCLLRFNPSQSFDYGLPNFDKIPSKFDKNPAECRVVPGAHVRWGAYVAPHCVLMPCFINIGAYVGKHTMVDTWSTIGSCAQIGAHCHISGGAGIGGVLEPLSAQPVIIGNHVFVGARAEIAEGIHVDDGAVIAAGTILTASTKIYDRESGKTTYGYIPKNAVVVPTYLTDKSGQFTRYAAMITKYADKSTRQKVGLNELLRN